MIIDGKHIAQKIEEKLLEELGNHPRKSVCFVLFGDDPASIQFIKIKTNIAERLGIKVNLVTAPGNIITDQALGLLDQVVSEDYDGIVIQLPLPKQLDAEKLLQTIPADKDIDALGLSEKTAPVARAIFEIFDFHNIDLANKEVLVIGNGRLVGKPVAQELARKGISYQVVDKDTDQGIVQEKIASADVIISGAGVPHMITSDMVKDGVILIDAGTSEQSGKLVGDIDPACSEKASLMTPVPGGVGPVTVVSLFANLL